MAVFTPPPPRAEPTSRWIRVRAGDTWIADSRRARLIVWYGPGRLPTYALPAEDVRTDLLTPAGDLRLGDRLLEGVATLLGDDAPPGTAGDWTFTWDGRVSWFEEATEVAVHARDPRHRVDAVQSERQVSVEIAGEVVAESRAAHALFETSLPTRWYFPPGDVRRDLLVPTDTTTRCPYKGTASRYWSVRVGAELHRDLAWSYPEPIPECPRIAGLVAFLTEREPVELVVDGERQERPVTPWSR